MKHEQYLESFASLALLTIAIAIISYCALNVWSTNNYFKIVFFTLLGIGSFLQFFFLFILIGLPKIYISLQLHTTAEMHYRWWIQVLEKHKISSTICAGLKCQLLEFYLLTLNNVAAEELSKDLILSYQKKHVNSRTLRRCARLFSKHGKNDQAKEFIDHLEGDESGSSLVFEQPLHVADRFEVKLGFCIIVLYLSIVLSTVTLTLVEAINKEYSQAARHGTLSTHLLFGMPIAQASLEKLAEGFVIRGQRSQADQISKVIVHIR
ncbi:MAG: hypothetical protein K2X77_02890 [Candidatus Obscuribacterales bacterium]|jgi:hypothetical protein|nr:hypothetical protein [Candidatus Obscuribacterales bacterium]